MEIQVAELLPAVSASIVSAVVVWPQADSVHGGIGLSPSGVIDSTHEPADAGFAMACGPICVVFACEYFGINKDLTETAASMDWKPDSGSSIASCKAALERTGHLHCRLAKLTIAELSSELSKPDQLALVVCVADEPGGAHLCAALGCSDRTWHMFDYPRMLCEVDASALAATWNGEAIIVSPLGPFERTILDARCEILGGLALISGGTVGLIRRRRSTRRPQASTEGTV